MSLRLAKNTNNHGIIIFRKTIVSRYLYLAKGYFCQKRHVSAGKIAATKYYFSIFAFLTTEKDK
jgi:hypothetical protein